MEGLGAGEEQVYPIRARPRPRRSLATCGARPARPQGRPVVPSTPARLAAALGGGGFFSEIRRADVLVHHPYDSFVTTFERFVREAGNPSVVTLKTTVYRTSDDSPVVPASSRPRTGDKRFVSWSSRLASTSSATSRSRALERAGVHVVYGFNLKIHAKTTLVVGAKEMRYAATSTSAPGTTTLDGPDLRGLGLLHRRRGDRRRRCRPLQLRHRFRTAAGVPQAPRRALQHAPPPHRGDSHGQKAASKGSARIRLKTNALTDETIIDELYAASQAGAEIDIVSRSICQLRPGVPALGVDPRPQRPRPLPRAQPLLRLRGRRFGDDVPGEPDLMTRNLDHRIEIAVPVEDPGVQAQLAAASTSCSTTTRPGRCSPTGPGSASSRARSRTRRGATTPHGAQRARRRVARRPR